MRKTLSVVPMTMCLALATYATEPNASSRGSIVTPTTGESWLHHLHRSFDETSMGKTGRLGPAANPDEISTDGSQLGFVPASPQALTLHGADLYRFNCQGCHGESGQGAPPEINSVINPIRATSIPLVIERMKKTGMEISTSAASQLAKQSQDSLLQRLHRGGESMPAFSQLSDAEIRTLIAYLKQLAAVPGAAQFSVAESPVRIGELIVKSTCHTCHDANGLNPTPQELENGAIPPLETLTTRTDQLQLIRKVTSGAPILMGTPPALHRGRMPVLYYLTREEAADVYLYLATVPPTTSVTAAVSESATPQDGSTENVSPAPAPPSLPPTSSHSATSNSPAISTGSFTKWDGVADRRVTIALLLMGGGVAGLLVIGLGFAAYELQRLGQKAEQMRKTATPPAPLEEEGEKFAISSAAGNFKRRAC